MIKHRKTETYTGGRIFTAADLVDFTPEGEARNTYKKLREEKFRRDAMKDSDEMKHTLLECLKGVALLAATALFCLVAIYWQDDILDFFRNILNK